MTSFGSPVRQTFAMAGDKSGPSHYRSSTSYSTAYTGSDGHIDDRSVPSVDLDRDGFDNIQLPAPSYSATPTRPALSSRLLSTLSSAQPTAAALTRKGSILHSRAKSWVTSAPKLNTSATTTPEKPQQSNRIFGDLFNGESAPIRLGIPPSSPIKEESEFVMEYKPTFTERPVGALRRQSTAAQSQIGNTPSATAKPGWFGRRTTLPPSSTPRQQDEILAIDLNSSLFPNGPADPLSPHAFNDLLLNATDLLQRMQSAYKEKVAYIASIQPEIDAQKEEVEEAETRATHLKLQLEDMARKADEQNQAMQEMAMELAQEKLRAQEAKEAAKSSIKLVRRSTDNTDGGEEGDTPRRRKRGSAGSASDSGFESDADYAESVMSGGAETPLTPPMMTLTPAYDGQDWPTKLRGERPAFSRQSTRSGSSQTAFTGTRLGSEGAAWATVEQLRGENRDLQRQMAEMQHTLQGCIDFVSLVKT